MQIGVEAPQGATAKRNTELGNQLVVLEGIRWQGGTLDAQRHWLWCFGGVEGRDQPSTWYSTPRHHSKVVEYSAYTVPQSKILVRRDGFSLQLQATKEVYEQYGTYKYEYCGFGAVQKVQA